MSLSQALPTTAIETMSELTYRSATGIVVSKGLAEGPYVVEARAGFKHATLRVEEHRLY